MQTVQNLLRLSDQFSLPGELTPAQAWRNVRQREYKWNLSVFLSTSKGLADSNGCSPRFHHYLGKSHRKTSGNTGARGQMLWVGTVQ